MRSAALLFVLTAACAPPSGPSGASYYVLDRTDGVSIPTVVDTTVVGSDSLQIRLLAAALDLSSRGRVLWKRSHHLESVGGPMDWNTTQSDELAGWYAMSGDEFVMELLTGRPDEGRTIRLSGTLLRTGEIELLVPRQGRPTRLESYRRVR